MLFLLVSLPGYQGFFPSGSRLHQTGSCPRFLAQLTWDQFGTYPIIINGSKSCGLNLCYLGVLQQGNSAVINIVIKLLLFLLETNIFSKVKLIQTIFFFTLLFRWWIKLVKATPWYNSVSRIYHSFF